VLIHAQIARAPCELTRTGVNIQCSIVTAVTNTGCANQVYDTHRSSVCYFLLNSLFGSCKSRGWTSSELGFSPCEKSMQPTVAQPHLPPDLLATTNDHHRHLFFLSAASYSQALASFTISVRCEIADQYSCSTSVDCFRCRCCHSCPSALI
jgi:hypothetical protein